MAAGDDQHDLEHLLGYLKTTRGFDFTGYKRASLTRRIVKRMHAVGIDAPRTYVDYLEVHPEEFDALFNTILINVTSFFRDPEEWGFLANEVMPALLAQRGPDDPIRLWSAGCASGQEPYTAAMLLAEAMGVDAFRRRVKIYATDVDTEALDQARQARYPQDRISDVPTELRERYFDQSDGVATFSPELRRSVIFGRHDLVQDAPIGRIDLLLCRNTLMYFNAETQARIVRRLHFALRNDGYLMLGNVEMLLAHTDLFQPVEKSVHVFRKIPASDLRARLGMIADPRVDATADGAASVVDLAFEASGVPQVVVDGGGMLRLANEQARAVFGLAPSDLSRPFQDTTLSYRPTDLRSAIDDARRTGSVRLEDVEFDADERVVSFAIEATAIPAPSPDADVLLTFFDVTRHHELERELQRSNRELANAYEELQATVEELETTNEELQSTVEELETTNEELQSTNEELETMNEELQSTNDELQAINEELRERSGELEDMNAFLESVFASMRGGVIVLDNDFKVQVWSQGLEELWRLAPGEVQGVAFLSLDIGLPVEQLAAPMRGALREGKRQKDLRTKATDRRGHVRELRVSCGPLTSRQGDTRGVILVVEPRDDPQATSNGSEGQA